MDGGFKLLILLTQVYGKRKKILLKIETAFFFQRFYSIAFPAWEPDSDEVLCAKFIYFYEPKCFRNHTEAIKEKIIQLQGIKRLQGIIKSAI